MSGLQILAGFLLLAGPSWAQEDYCVEQPRAVEAFAGEALTLPCTFVHPEKPENISEVTIIWKANQTLFCGKDENEFYNSKTNVIFPQYQGRLVLAGDLNTQNGSLMLAQAMAADSNRYCCRVGLRFLNNKYVQYQSLEGTKLTVREDNELKLEQPSFIPAFNGEAVTFLVRFSVKTNTTPRLMSYGLWRAPGPHSPCNTLIHSGSFGESFRGNVLHFRINQSQPSLVGWYCWEINSTSSQNHTVTSTKHFGTELVIVERTNQLGIFQPPEIVFEKNTEIECKFERPQFSNIIKTEVYWMTGEPREDYVYHPNPDFIHQNYRGKTKLVNGPNLLLEDFQGPENTTFYCQVMIQRCGRREENRMKSEIIMEEGPGTSLKAPVDPEQTLPFCPQSLMIAVSALAKFILLLVLFIMALIYIKKN